jgi:tetratricopeptide (TPR) repeat protein
MNDLPLTEALARVWQEKATGQIKIKTGDRESKLLFERGDLVGADLRFGYQSVAQSLLAEGRIGLEDLDALWARGEGPHLARETLARWNLEPRESWELQLFAALRRLCLSANAVEFAPGLVQTRFDRVPGQRLLSALRSPGSSDDFILQSTTPTSDVANAPFSAGEQASAQPSQGRTAGPTHNDNAKENGETLGAAPIQPPALEEDPLFNEGDLADRPDPAELARQRRQRLLKRAMENMGAPGSARPVGGEVVRPAATPEPRVEAAPQTTDEEQLAAAINERFSEVQSKKDYFTLLRVPRSATTEEVKTAFLQLAKVFHPDRLPSSLHPLSPKITAIFEAIREAYETLQVESKRKAYLASLEAAAPSGHARSANAANDAAEALKAGDVLMRKKDFEAAEQEYHRAHQLDPKPVYKAAEAWAIYLDPTRKAEAALAKQMMIEALRSDPECDRAKYQLGVIARVEGAIDRAEKYFREALKINPKHVEAAQELRIIEMRKKGSGKRGFFR